MVSTIVVKIKNFVDTNRYIFRVRFNCLFLFRIYYRRTVWIPRYPYSGGVEVIHIIIRALEVNFESGRVIFC